MKLQFLFSVACLLGPSQENGSTLEDAARWARADGRLIAIAMIPDCCSPCATEARAALRDPDLVAWLQRRAWLVEYDATRDAEALPSWTRGRLKQLVLARADGSEVGQLAWRVSPSRRLLRLEELANGYRAPRELRSLAYSRGEDPSARQDRAWALAQRGDAARALMERAEAQVLLDASNLRAWQDLTSLAGDHGARYRVCAFVSRFDHSKPLPVHVRLELLDELMYSFLERKNYQEVLWLCAGSPLEVAKHWIAELEAKAVTVQTAYYKTGDPDEEGLYGVSRGQMKVLIELQRTELCSRIADLHEATLAFCSETAAQSLVDLLNAYRAR